MFSSRLLIPLSPSKVLDHRNKTNLLAFRVSWSCGGFTSIRLNLQAFDRHYRHQHYWYISSAAASWIKTILDTALMSSL
jgi:hypothetical protein